MIITFHVSADRLQVSTIIRLSESRLNMVKNTHTHTPPHYALLSLLSTSERVFMDGCESVCVV